MDAIRRTRSRAGGDSRNCRYLARGVIGDYYAIQLHIFVKAFHLQRVFGKQACQPFASN